jgi:hypothetical protein
VTVALPPDALPLHAASYAAIMPRPMLGQRIQHRVLGNGRGGAGCDVMRAEAGSHTGDGAGQPQPGQGGPGMRHGAVGDGGIGVAVDEKQLHGCAVHA